MMERFSDMTYYLNITHQWQLTLHFCSKSQGTVNNCTKRTVGWNILSSERKSWRVYNSTEIASFVGGIPSGPPGSYKATENGTLIIKKVSLDDEGKYICRVLSELSDCNGEILVYVQGKFEPTFSGLYWCLNLRYQ